jgi:MFS family permease
MLAVLGLPTLALALSITVLTTYLPLLAQRFTSSTTVIGVIIGGEGVVALVLPLVVGPWSDQLETRIGGRLPFMIAALPVLAGSLAVVGFASTLGLVALLVFVFFVAYYVAYEPYRALYPDVLEVEIAGRGQSTQAIFRGAGTGLALVGGGLLFGVAPPLPFVVAAVLTFGLLAEFAYGMAGRDRRPETHEPRGVRETLTRVKELLREEPELRTYFAANTLWELSLAALKTFVILYLTVGLGYKIGTAVAIVALVAVLVLIAAAVSGKLGDRFGKTRVVVISLWVYGIGLLVPFATHVPFIVISVLPLVAFGGGTLLSLPYAVLIPLMPDDEHGLLTGFYSVSRGLGILLGPLVAGAAVELLRPELSSTEGYAAMWLVCGAAILASIPYATKLHRRAAAAGEEEIDVPAILRAPLRRAFG